MNISELKKIATLREQILSLLIIVALFVMFFRIIYFPRRDSARQMKNQIQTLRLEKDALQKFTQALAKTPSKIPPKIDSSPKIRILKKEEKPVAANTATLLAHITNPQFLRGVTIKSMSDLPAKKETGYEMAHFSLHAQGSFHNLNKYLERIEQIPALLVIENISLKAIDLKAAFLELEIDGSLYKLETKNAASL